MLERLPENSAMDGAGSKILGHGLASQHWGVGRAEHVAEAFPPHVSHLVLERVLFKEDEFNSGKSIAIGALGFTRLPWDGLRRSPPFNMESIWINCMYGNEILRHNFRPQAREFQVFFLVSWSSVTSHDHTIPRVIVQQ
jgi:hypothetical protein